MRIRILSLLLLFSQLNAAQQNKAKQLQRIKCSADSTQEYALYLPSHYSLESKYPVIIFLDPAARGNFPVDKYYLLAEEYGVIMAGSFNSKNFDEASSFESFVTIYNDLMQRHSVDTQMVWVAGFSGGSRASSAIAMAYPQISGVIACGAGFAGTQEISTKNLKAYAAIVGDKDMNFGELLENNEYLDEIGISNILLVFDGGHDWPPVTKMSLAFLWLKDNPDKINTVSERFDSVIWNSINLKVDSGFLYAAWTEAKQLERIPILKQKASLMAIEIANHKNFIADRNSFEQVMEEERKYMNEFSIAFNQLLIQNSVVSLEKDAWLQKAERVKQMKKDQSGNKQLSGKRCYDHSTRSCLEYYFQLMNRMEYNKAATIAEVMLCFDPQSSNTCLMMARAEAGAGSKKRCERNLKYAIKRGLTLSKRIEEDDLLLSVLSAAEIRKMFERK
jgi:pimeloyl-ACP methyl ester carboxylesterase